MVIFAQIGIAGVLVAVFCLGVLLLLVLLAVVIVVGARRSGQLGSTNQPSARCPDCGRPVSDEAINCPECQRRLKV